MNYFNFSLNNVCVQWDVNKMDLENSIYFCLYVATNETLKPLHLLSYAMLIVIERSRRGIGRCYSSSFKLSYGYVEPKMKEIFLSPLKAFYIMNHIDMVNKTGF